VEGYYMDGKISNDKKINDTKNYIETETEMQKIFVRRLKWLRENAELTLAELAKRLREKYGIGVTYGSLGNYERAYRMPSLFILSKIADYFSVTSDYLIGLSDIKNAKVPQTTLFDKNNEPHNVKIGFPNDSELADMSIKEISEFVKRLRNLGVDLDKMK
jgi:transcriptional regulator with XRE-family HTH domain